ncbi:MAG: hypothetical protein HOI23_01540 [Deltaproteobacteria bacterium]|nr:hypothetical protein [Deltaproteobacteria bacterium]MBT6432860.1 hypothetical protein [Deltaproteobacteria bacterium]
MLLESKRWFVLCLAMALAACGSEGTGEGDSGDSSETTEAVGDNTATDTNSTGGEPENDPDSTESDTQTDDESTDDAGTQTDDESTDDAGTQTDDESTDDAGTQTDDESTDDAGTQTDDDSGDIDANPDTSDETTPDDTGDTDSEDDSEYTGHDLNGKWEGSYTCSQGFTRLTLQVVHNMDGHGLEAVFAFYADDSNPEVPTGRYTMIGSYEPASGNVDLNELEWIEQPGGYVMVSLDGFINDEGTSITGTVDNSGCTEFTVVRGN